MVTSRAVGLRRALVGFAALLAVTAGAALAADPIDTTFGANGIAEIEARVTPQEDVGQVGGIADLEPTSSGKMLAAVYPIASRGHYFAAARIAPDGALDPSFGKKGFTPYINVSYRKGENGGVLQGEAVAGLKDGKVLLAGYYENGGEFAPALARFTARGTLDPSFGRGGKVILRPSFEGRPIETEGGGERLHDVAIEPGGTIVGVGDVVAAPRNTPGVGPTHDAALVIAYRPDGKIDRGFGHDGRLRITLHRNGPYSGYTGFTEVKALPSGKLLVSGYIHQRYVLYRLTADGRIDRSFGAGTAGSRSRSRGRGRSSSPPSSRRPSPSTPGAASFSASLSSRKAPKSPSLSSASSPTATATPPSARASIWNGPRSTRRNPTRANTACSSSASNLWRSRSTARAGFS
jgi:uncharacterized delta-60 repeat protein